MSTYEPSEALMRNHVYGAMAHDCPWLLMVLSSCSWFLMSLYEGCWCRGTGTMLISINGCWWAPMSTQELGSKHQEHLSALMSAYRHFSALISTHEQGAMSPLSLISAREHSWTLINGIRSIHEHLWCNCPMLMTAHKCLWVLMSAHGRSWSTLSAYCLIQ